MLQISNDGLLRYDILKEIALRKQSSENLEFTGSKF